MQTMPPRKFSSSHPRPCWRHVQQHRLSCSMLWHHGQRHLPRQLRPRSGSNRNSRHGPISIGLHTHRKKLQTNQNNSEWRKQRMHRCPAFPMCFHCRSQSAPQCPLLHPCTSCLQRSQSAHLISAACMSTARKPANDAMWFVC
jgi:hypothetical protein